MNRRTHDRVVEEALERNAADLLAYFQRRVLQREDAADLLGESFTIAWRRRWSCPDHPTQARMWLFTIGRHVLANHRRSSRRSEELVRRLREELAVAAVPAGEGSSPMVDEAMEALAPEQRELVRLVHWEGFGVAEAGQILGVGASTARSRYATARERLRRSLSGSRDPSSILG